MRVLILFVFVFTGCLSCSAFAQNNDAKPLLVRVVKPDFSVYSDTVECRGKTIRRVEKTVEVPLFCTVKELLVGTGYMVEQGQPIAEFDLSAEKKKNEVMASELERLRLLEKSLSERKEQDGNSAGGKRKPATLRGSKKIRIDLGVISDRVKELERIVAQHAEQIDTFSVTAPLSGEIIFAPGVEDGAECEPGTVFARVKGRRRKIVEIQTDPMTLARLFCSAIPASIEVFDSHLANLKVFSSPVFKDSIHVSGSSADNIICRLELDDVDNKLELGEEFSAQIVFCSERMAAKIPMESLFYLGNGIFGVFVVGKDYRVEVSTFSPDCVLDADTVLVSSGLKSGSWVIDRRSGVLLEPGQEVDPVFGEFEKIKQVPARGWGATQVGIWADLKVFVPESLMIPGMGKKDFAAVFTDSSDKAYWDVLKKLSEDLAFVLVGAPDAFSMPPWSEKGRNARAALSVAVRAYGVNPDRVFVFGADRLGALFFSGWYDTLVDGVISIMPDGLEQMPDWPYWLFRPGLEALFLVPKGSKKENPMKGFLAKRGWTVLRREADFVADGDFEAALGAAIETFTGRGTKPSASE